MQERIARCRGRKWALLSSCVLIAGLYWCSIWAQFGVPTPPGEYLGLGPRSALRLAVGRGGLTIATAHVPNPPTYPRPALWGWMMSEGHAEWLPRYDHTAAAVGGGWDVRLVHIPWWIPLIAAAALAVRAWRADARAQRILSLGHCGVCGYDRKGIADATACPECGASASP
jgi:hypothetical protein